MNMNFSRKHVVITGGSEGIGLALAEEFVKAGSFVTIISRDLNKLSAAKSILMDVALKQKSKSIIFTQPADVTSLSQVGAS
jgi:NAD(P)-dependent dehydrogenase (short-subunit alcohol dehydrogenase family)